MKTFRGGSGLGDSLYLQAVARYWTARKSERICLRSDFPDIFLPLADRVVVKPFSKIADVLAHYSSRKGITGSTQFEDVCACAGIAEPVELRLDWQPQDRDLIKRLRDHGRPICVVQLPRAPMGRKDGFGSELLPDCKAVQLVIDRVRERALIVQVGAGEPLHRFSGINIDLANRTTVAQVIDAVSCADAVVGYCSFLLPLAESLNKPAIMVWSSRGLRAGHPYIRRIVPAKCIHRKDLVKAVMDDAKDDVRRAADAFLLAE